MPCFSPFDKACFLEKQWIIRKKGENNIAITKKNDTFGRLLTCSGGISQMDSLLN